MGLNLHQNTARHGTVGNSRTTMLPLMDKKGFAEPTAIMTFTYIRPLTTK